VLKDNEQYAYFVVYGDFDPAEVTRRVGRSPTNSWRRGDLCPKTQRERSSSAWSIYSRLAHDEELEAHVRDVLQQLDAFSEAIRQISQEFDAQLQLVAYWHRNYPGLYFTRDISQGLARYSLSVDFDFYYLYSFRREATT
jgi:hypothetical protein